MLHYVNGISLSSRSPVSLRLEVVRDSYGLQFSLLSPILHAALLNYCSSLPIATSGPMSVAPLFSITHHGSAFLVDPRLIKPAYARPCFVDNSGELG